MIDHNFLENKKVIAVLLYALFVFIGLYFSVSIDVASTLWPATGLGLACLCIYGFRYGAILWIVECLVRYTFYLFHPDPEYSSLGLIAGSFSTGSVFSLMLGSQLIKQYVALDRRLIHFNTIIRLIFICGVITPLVSSCLDLVGIRAFALVPEYYIVSNGILLFTSKAIGLAFIAPALLILHYSVRHNFIGRLKFILLPSLTLYSLATGICCLIIHIEQDDISNKFQVKMLKQTIEMWTRLKNITRSTENLALYVKYKNETRETGFKKVYNKLQQKHDSVVMFEWLPLVDTFQEFKSILDKEVANFYKLGRIADLSKKINQEATQTHLPIYYMFPVDRLSKIKSISGLKKNVLSTLLQRALKTNKIVVSTPFEISRKNTNGFGVALIQSVIAQNSFKGVVVSIVHLNQIFDSLVKNQNVISSFKIRDLSNDKTVYQWHEKNEAHNKSVLIYKREITIGHKYWLVTAKSSSDVWLLLYSSLLTLVMLSAYLIAVLLVMILIFVHGKNEIVRRDIFYKSKQLESEQLFSKSILESTFEGMIGLNEDFEIKFFNTSALKLLGYKASQLIDKNFEDTILNELSGRRRYKIEKLFERSSEVVFIKHDKSLVWVTVSINRINQKHDDCSYVVIFNDITDKKQAELKLKKMAFEDSLTDVPNREHFFSVLDKTIANAKKNNSHFALCFIDIDNFKHVNDAYGHQSGDDLLVEVAKRVTKELRLDNDFFARIGGDEFVVIINNVDNKLMVSPIIERYWQAVSEPYCLAKQEMKLTFSLGVCFYPLSGDTAKAMMQNSDAAMYKAKQKGKNRIMYFDENTMQQVSSQNQIASYLQTGLQEREMTLAHQSIFNQTQHPIGREIFMRWHSSEIGEVQPEKFIAAFDDTTLIPELNDWFFEQLAQILEKQDDSLDGLIFINLSFKQLEAPSFDKNIKKLQGRFDLSSFVFELTEQALMKDMQLVINKMQHFTSLGAQFALDNFGKGFSSMSYLKVLPISYVKIDKLFMKDLSDNAQALAIVKAIVEMSKALGVEVIAQGVESAEIMQELLNIGVKLMQGYYLQQPQSI